MLIQQSTTLGRFIATVAFFLLSIDGATGKTENHALAMHGKPKYTDGFTHFDYVNPNAPKGGGITRSADGTFDTFNGFIPKGKPAAGTGYIYDTLTVASHDEPFTQYGLLAKSIVVPKTKDSVTFILNTDARFHDGTPVTATDVEFSFNALVKHGRPFYAAYYADVTSVDVVDNNTITFHFRDGKNRELPLILGQLVVLPAHYWKGKEFTSLLLDPPLGSGPYKIASFNQGKDVTISRVEDYWAKDHPTRKGQFNYDSIRFEYYRDRTVALEAFKSKSIDMMEENSSKRWATRYVGDAFDNGEIIKQTITHENPAGMQAFAMNSRRERFQDSRVRQALGLVFDFEWTNKNLFYGAYTRSTSYFSNSELASDGLPSKAELALLEPYRDDLPSELFTEPYSIPKTKGNGKIRLNLRTATKLLKQAGWTLHEGSLVNKDGLPFEFEILLYQGDFKRIVLPYVKNLEKLGITPTIKVVDVSQFIERRREFDFDMIIQTFAQSSSPGNEQRDYWYSGYANHRGSRNIIGIKDPVIDQLIDNVIAAESRDDLITACHALDRVLLWGHYVVPQWHISAYRVAYRDFFRRPETTPKYSLGFDTWWVDQPAASSKMQAKK
ncbi:hypothetical protein A9Q99_26650 [Gammaproteobacteria bacterium 45_16_T64]|nr:hypothetical protein A9Q99_26650 [Gammaproteobacteria bacterium 45_16_T64]